MEYKSITLPENLVSTIYRLTIEKVGIYNGAVHSFRIPTFDTTEQRETIIREVYSRYSNLDPFEFYNILNYVIDNVDTSPRLTSPQSIVLEGNNAISPLDYLVFIEENSARTDLIYLGMNRFYVLATSRSTVMPSDVLETRKLPINLREEFSMNIYREKSGTVRFRPQGCEEYDPAVIFSPLTSIYKYSSPEVYTIVDDEEVFGGSINRTLRESTLQKRFFTLKKSIEESMAKWEKTLSESGAVTLPDNAKYPEYDEILKVAMSNGIGMYVLNTLIEFIEKKSSNEYCYIEEDWDLNLTPEQIEEIERRERQAKIDAVTNLESELNKVLKEVKTRRVWIFFKAPGRLHNVAYLEEVKTKLDNLSDEGYGHTKGWAKQEIDRAIASSKPAPLYNLKVAVVMVVMLILAVFTAYTWVTTKNSLETFEQNIVNVMTLANDDKYHEARTELSNARSSFFPGYMSFVIYGRTKKTESEIEELIDRYVDDTVEQIGIMRSANWGRIDEYCWDLIKTAMEFRPDDSRLIDMRNDYINQ